MEVYEIYGGGKTGQFYGVGDNVDEKTIDFSSFSPNPTEFLSQDSVFFVAASLSYHIYCGMYGNPTYKGDCGLSFSGNGYTLPLIEKKVGVGYQTGYQGYSGTDNIPLTYFTENGEFSHVTGYFEKSVMASALAEYDYGLTSVYVQYYYLPYKVSLIHEHGTIRKKAINKSTDTVQLEAIPDTGYHFVRWHDGNTNSIREETITGDCEFIAYFEPNEYTIKLYDYTSGEAILLHTLKGVYDQELVAPSLPERVPPEGHGFNTGWVAGKTSIPNNIQWDTKEMYYTTSTTSKVKQKTVFFNETSTNGGIVEFCCNFHPYQYSISYKKFLQGSRSNYTVSTVYRIYNNGDVVLANLPTPSTGYKLLNQINELKGPVDPLITNQWFTSFEALSPEDEKINSVSSLHIGNLDVYSFEIPIDYTTIFNVYDIYGEKIAEYTMPSQYDKNLDTSSIDLSEKKGQIFSGWYSLEQDILNLYFEPNSNTIIANASDVVANDFNSPIKNLTTIDQNIIYRYGYYIPKSYLLFYDWLDQWDPDNPEFSLPATGFRVYGRDALQVEPIPNYEEYTIDNVNSIKWYYVDRNSILQTNNFETIPNDIDENLFFYAKKEPKEREITFSINREDWGKIVRRNASSNDRYEQGYILEVYAEPLLDTVYFSHWSDGSTWPARNIEVGSHHTNYEAIFRNNQIFAPRPKGGRK